MKHTILAISSALILGALAVPVSASWDPAIDLRPEALVTGGTLLVLAAVLRRSAPAKQIT